MSLKEKIEKLEEIGIEFNEQKKSNVEEFFKKELKCANVPKDVLDFYLRYDGCLFCVGSIFSLKEMKTEMKEYKEDFIQGMGIDSSKYNFMLIAEDGMGGYYAFDADNEEATIYYLDHENPDEYEKPFFKNFEDFLEDRYNMEIYISNEQE